MTNEENQNFLEQKHLEAEATKRSEKVKKPKKASQTQPQVTQPQGNVQMDGNVFHDAVVNAIGDTIRGNQQRSLHQTQLQVLQQTSNQQQESDVSVPTGSGKLKGGQYVPQVATADYNRSLNYTPLHQRFRDANQQWMSSNPDYSRPPPNLVSPLRPIPENNERQESNQNGRQRAPPRGPPDEPSDDSSDETSNGSRGNRQTGNGQNNQGQNGGGNRGPPNQGGNGAPPPGPPGGPPRGPPGGPPGPDNDPDDDPYEPDQR